MGEGKSTLRVLSRICSWGEKNHGGELKCVMPNLCMNALAVYGPKEDVEAFKQKAVGQSPWLEAGQTAELSPLNFHSLVPIPDGILQAGYDPAGFD